MAVIKCLDLPRHLWKCWWVWKCRLEQRNMFRLLGWMGLLQSWVSSGEACSSSAGPLRTGTPPSFLRPGRNGDGTSLCSLFFSLSLSAVYVCVHVCTCMYTIKILWVLEIGPFGSFKFSLDLSVGRTFLPGHFVTYQPAINCLPLVFTSGPSNWVRIGFFPPLGRWIIFDFFYKKKKKRQGSLNY